MEKQIITFSANEQTLTKTGGVDCYASNTVAYIEARFDLGDNWSGYDSVRAVWFTDFVGGISTVLDSDGVCIVPHEVLTRKSAVKVNLVGSISVSDVLTDRLTTFPCEALKVSAKAKISGSETAAVTPSQFEQFVAAVISEVEKVTGMTAQAETLPAGSQATARYEDGILYLGIPQGIQGERGETGADGNGIASVVYNADYTLTLVFDNGERFTTPPIRGERGPAGADGRDGTDGADGVTPNISIGNVETLEPSEDAYVTRRGTDANPIFDFGIPKGDKGDTGEVTMSQLSSLLPTDTASGDIVTITDGQSVVPAKSLKVALEPIQSGTGTPSPDNVRPISGHTECVTERRGKNLLPPKFYSGIGYNGAVGTVYTPTDITDTFTETDGVFSKSVSAWGGASMISEALPNGSYRINVAVTSSGLRLTGYILDADYKVIRQFDLVGSGTSYSENRTITLSDNETYIALYVASNVSGSISFGQPQIEYGSTATSYEPYQGTSYTTALGQTVYGGTLDVVSGELVVDRAAVDLGTLNWGYSTADKRFYNNTLSYNHTNPNAICSQYKSVSISALADGTFCAYSNGYLYVKDLRYTDTTTFKTAMNGVQLVYELATPQTIQLTPQEVKLLTGTNNIWSNGDVTLVYSADIQKWVEKKLNANSTTSMLTMSRPMVQTETTETEETETETAETE